MFLRSIFGAIKVDTNATVVDIVELYNDSFVLKELDETFLK